MPRPSRRGKLRALLTGEVSTGVVSGDDIDWSAGVFTDVGADVTVSDEGVALATAASTLDFVGAGVTASGSGATKTITIPGGATATDTYIWRPLLASDGTIITAGAGGEAVMAYGPA